MERFTNLFLRGTAVAVSMKGAITAPPRDAAVHFDHSLWCIAARRRVSLDFSRLEHTNKICPSSVTIKPFNHDLLNKPSCLSSRRLKILSFYSSLMSRRAPRRQTDRYTAAGAMVQDFVDLKMRPCMLFAIVLRLW